VSAASVQIRFEQAEFVGIEGAGINDLSWAIVRVVRTGDLTQTSTVQLTMTDGTAKSTTDYHSQIEGLIFQPGETSKDVFIGLKSDFIYEGTESFTVTLRNASPEARIAFPSTAAVMIDDKLDYPSVSVGGGFAVEPGPGRTTVKHIIISVSNPSVEAVSVSFATSDGTALAGEDYQETTGIVTLPPLLLELRAPVIILGDEQNEPRETFTVALSNPVNATVGIPSEVTIINHLPYRQHVDFDGDAYADLATFHSTSGVWFGGSSSYSLVTFGMPTDILVAADYTGDGRTDVAVWRPESGDWHILRSEDQSYFSFHFGTTADVPAPADFDGDGTADYGVFRPSTGSWYIWNSRDGSITTTQFGTQGDRPVPADYDGDWKADLAVYRPDANGASKWWIRRSSDSVVRTTGFGLASDITVPADYSGDGKADIAVWRPATAEWFILRSDDGTVVVFVSGLPNKSKPAPGDYTATGGFEAAVLTMNENTGSSVWHVRYDSVNSAFTGAIFGDVPVATVNVR
jgi:hypothetical protein